MAPNEFVDATLGDLTEIIDSAAVTQTLTTNWPDSGASMTIEHVDRHWVRSSPGTRCLAVHRVHGYLDGLPHTTFVVAERNRFETMWTTLANDPVLVELPAVLDPARVAGALGPFASGGTVIPLRYRPGRRCTLSVHSDRGAVFAKVLADGAARQRAFLDTWPSRGTQGFAVPRLWRPQSAPRFVVTEPLEGRSAWAVLTSGDLPIGERVSISQDIGARLADLHKLPPVKLPVGSLANELGALGSSLNAVDQHDPSTAAVARKLLSQLGSVGEWNTKPATCHGSFRFDQVLIDQASAGPDQLTLMDFDSLGANDSESDLGNCLAYLTWRQIRDPQAKADLSAIGSAFVDGYRAAGGVISRHRLAAFHAASCLKIAWRRYANLDVSEWPLVSELLAVAADHLSTPTTNPLFITNAPSSAGSNESEVV